MANQILIAPETTVEFRDTGGDETLVLASLAAGAGRLAALHDWGAAPRATRYQLKFFCQFNTTPVIGETVRISISEAGLAATGSDATSSGPITQGPMTLPRHELNLRLIAVLTVDEASTSGVMSVEAIFETAARHFGPAVVNNTADALSSTAADNGVDITPIPDEIQ